MGTIFSWVTKSEPNQAYFKISLTIQCSIKNNDELLDIFKTICVRLNSKPVGFYLENGDVIFQSIWNHYGTYHQTYKMMNIHIKEFNQNGLQVLRQRIELQLGSGLDHFYTEINDELKPGCYFEYRLKFNTYRDDILKLIVINHDAYLLRVNETFKHVILQVNYNQTYSEARKKFIALYEDLKNNEFVIMETDCVYVVLDQ